MSVIKINIEYYRCKCGGKIKKIGPVWQCDSYWMRSNFEPHQIIESTKIVKEMPLTRREYANLYHQFGQQTAAIISEAKVKI